MNPWFVVLAVLTPESTLDGIAVEAHWRDPPPFFVGQAIGVEVRCPFPGDRPELVVPKVVSAELVKIADLDNGWDLRLIASKAGPLRVPPFSVRFGSDSRVVRSSSLSATIRDLPAAGRTRAFLGGVGTLESIRAEALPNSIRLGQTFEYRLTLAGPAARGSTAKPDYAAWDRTNPGLRVVDLPDEFDTSADQRTHRFRVRPTRAGETALPPLAVAFFDPKVQSYQTRLGPRVTINVLAPPAFGPDSIVEAPERPTNDPWVGNAVITVVATVLAAVLLIVSKRLLDVRRGDPARLLKRRARALQSREAVQTLAQQIQGDLVDYLRLAVGRPSGVLTPGEGADAIASLHGDTTLVEQTRDLIAACDRARYGPAVGGPTREGLQRQAMETYQGLGRVAPKSARPMPSSAARGGAVDLAE